MINLVPQQAKKNLQKEYWLRVATVWMYLWALMLVCGAFVLVPSYVLIDTQVAAYEQSAAEVSQKLLDFNVTSTALVRASQQAKIILDERSVLSIAELTKLFQQLQGSSIEITDVSVSRDGIHIAPIRISGIAADRQSLAEFRDTLLGQPMIASVDLPISSLARDKDLQFSLTVTIHKKTDS